MKAKTLIKAIHRHHLEDFNIYDININLCNTVIRISFDGGTTELPYPEYKDKNFDEPAYIYRTKILEIDENGNTKCHDEELNTSQ